MKENEKPASKLAQAEESDDKDKKNEKTDKTEKKPNPLSPKKEEKPNTLEKKIESILKDPEVTKEKDNSAAASEEVKVIPVEKKGKGATITPVNASTGNAVLVTGATHARELLSAQVPLFLCLKLLH